MTKSTRQIYSRKRGGGASYNVGKTKLEIKERVVQVPTRRRTRQGRRLRGVSTWKKELGHFLTPAAKKASTSHSRSTSACSRYVKSKPPKAMPGGRVICCGQGTLTEVSRSFYVPYGLTSFNTAVDSAPEMGYHLVVPVRDELQDVSDEELFLDSSTYLAPEECLMSEIEQESPHQTPKECELPIHDHPCVSMVLMDSPQMSAACACDSLSAVRKQAAFHNAMNQMRCLQEEREIKSSSCGGTAHNDIDVSSQIPMTWWGPPPSLQATTMVNGALPYDATSDLVLPVPQRADNDSWYMTNVGKRGSSDDSYWESYMSPPMSNVHRVPSQMSIQEACRYRPVSEEKISHTFGQANTYVGSYDSEMSHRNIDDMNYLSLPDEVLGAAETKPHSQQESKIHHHPHHYHPQDYSHKRPISHHQSRTGAWDPMMMTTMMMSNANQGSDLYQLANNGGDLYLNSSHNSNYNTNNNTNSNSSNSANNNKCSSTLRSLPRQQHPFRLLDMDPFNINPSLRALDASVCRQHASTNGTVAGSNRLMSNMNMSQNWPINRGYSDFKGLSPLLTENNFYQPNSNLLI